MHAAARSTRTRRPAGSGPRVRDRLGVDVAGHRLGLFGRPWRWGIVDVAIGVSGLAPARRPARHARRRRPGHALDGPGGRRRDRLGRRARPRQDAPAGRSALVRGARVRPAARASIRDVAHARASPTSSAESRRRCTVRPRQRRSGTTGARSVKFGLQITSFTWPGGAAAHRPDPRPRSSGRPTTSASTRSGSWTTSSRSAASGAEDEPMLEGWTDARLHGRPLERARLGLMVGGIHYRQPGPVGQGRDDARRPVRRPGLARASAPPGTRRSRAASASRSRRSASASRCSRRRSGSPTRCGRASAAREARFEGRHVRATRLLNSPQSISRPAVADHDRRRRRAEDAPPRRPVRRRDATSSAARSGSPQVRGPARALRGGRPRPTTRSSARRSSRSTSAHDGRRGARDARTRSSTASASSATPAPSTSSSASADVDDTGRHRAPRPRRSSRSCRPSRADRELGRRYPQGVSFGDTIGRTGGPIRTPGPRTDPSR